MNQSSNEILVLSLLESGPRSYLDVRSEYGQKLGFNRPEVFSAFDSIVLDLCMVGLVQEETDSTSDSPTPAPIKGIRLSDLGKTKLMQTRQRQNA